MAKDLHVSTIVASYQTTGVIALSGKSNLRDLFCYSRSFYRNCSIPMDPFGQRIWPPTGLFGISFPILIDTYISWSPGNCTSRFHFGLRKWFINHIPSLVGRTGFQWIIKRRFELVCWYSHRPFLCERKVL